MSYPWLAWRLSLPGTGRPERPDEEQPTVTIADQPDLSKDEPRASLDPYRAQYNLEYGLRLEVRQFASAPPAHPESHGADSDRHIESLTSRAFRCNDDLGAHGLPSRRQVGSYWGLSWPPQEPDIHRAQRVGADLVTDREWPGMTGLYRPTGRSIPRQWPAN